MQYRTFHGLADLSLSLASTANTQPWQNSCTKSPQNLTQNLTGPVDHTPVNRAGLVTGKGDRLKPVVGHMVWLGMVTGTQAIPSESLHRSMVSGMKAI